MRPTMLPSVSRTLAPSRSSTCTSTLFFLLRAAAGNALDDVLRYPDLLIEGAGFLGFAIELDVFADCLDLGPRDSDGFLSAGTPQMSNSGRQPAQGWMQSRPQRLAANQNVSHTRLRRLSHMHEEPADSAHVALLAIDQLLVEHIAYEIHLSPQ